MSARTDERLWALAESGPRLAQCQTMDELTRVGTELGRKVVQANAASISRIDHSTGRLHVLRNAGELADWEEEAPEDEVYDLADFPLLASTVEHAAPWFGHLGDAQSEAGDAHQELLASMGMATSISIPIIVGSTVWGELGASRRAGLPFYEAIDVAAGQTFAALFAASIARLDEEDELRRLAFLDGLTGLGNRRALDQRLEAAFAAPIGRPIGLVLCDVDGLKRINDHHGHDSGDLVLREVAARLTAMASAHPGSLAARFGGDEFALVVEGVDDLTMQRITQRLQRAGEELPFGAGLSCGWSSHDRRSLDPIGPMATARGLLRLADAAQYRAKRLGTGVGTRVSGTTVGANRDDGLGARLTREATTQLAGVTDVLSRLEVLMMACADVLDASAGSVSVSVDDGPLIVVTNVVNARLKDRGRRSTEPGAAYELDDYPATRAVLSGGAFHADLDVGDDHERAFLAANGHDELIATGQRQDHRVAWLLEVFADAMSMPLRGHTPLIEALMALAVQAGVPLDDEELGRHLPQPAAPER